MTNWSATSAPYLAPRQPGQSDAWTAEAASAGRIGSQKLLVVDEEAPPPEVDIALGLYGGPAVLRRRLVLLDGIPVEIADSWYPPEIARGTRLAENRRIPGGAVTYLAELGYTAQRSGEDVSAPVAADWQAEILGLQYGSRLLQLMRVVHGAPDATPFEVTVMAMNPELPGGELRRLRYELTLD